jgi:hypothetical protein
MREMSRFRDPEQDCMLAWPREREGVVVACRLAASSVPRNPARHGAPVGLVALASLLCRRPSVARYFGSAPPPARTMPSVATGNARLLYQEHRSVHEGKRLSSQGGGLRGRRWSGWACVRSASDAPWLRAGWPERFGPHPGARGCASRGFLVPLDQSGAPAVVVERSGHGLLRTGCCSPVRSNMSVAQARGPARSHTRLDKRAGGQSSPPIVGSQSASGPLEMRQGSGTPNPIVVFASE